MASAGHLCRQRAQDLSGNWTTGYHGPTSDFFRPAKDDVGYKSGQFRVYYQFNRQFFYSSPKKNEKHFHQFQPLVSQPSPQRRYGTIPSGQKLSSRLSTGRGGTTRTTGLEIKLKSLQRTPTLRLSRLQRRRQREGRTFTGRLARLPQSSTIANPYEGEVGGRVFWLERWIPIPCGARRGGIDELFWGFGEGRRDTGGVTNSRVIFGSALETGKAFVSAALRQ